MKLSEFFIAVYLNARIQPLDRGDRYEDPLDTALSEMNLGNIVGGGSAVSPQGNEITSCALELQVNDLEKALPLICRVLGDAGAPKGSFVEFEQESTFQRIPFGTKEGIALYLNGTSLPESVYASCDIHFVISELNCLLDGLGEFQGYFESNLETALYFYGTDRGVMRSKIGGFLDSYPLCHGARVVDLPDEIDKDA